MRLDKLWLTDFRSYESAELALAPGLTAVLGENGRGKSNLLEAIAWLATLESFRGAPTEALVRSGAERAVLLGHRLRVVDDEQDVELAVDAGRHQLLLDRVGRDLDGRHLAVDARREEKRGEDEEEWNGCAATGHVRSCRLARRSITENNGSTW